MKKINMKVPRQPMKEQPPEERVKRMNEFRKKAWKDFVKEKDDIPF